MMRSPYASPAPRRSREFLALLVALVVAAAVLAGGYALATHTKLPFTNYLTGNQPTPVSTIQALVALTQIQHADPYERVSYTSPLINELDLVTTNPQASTATYSPQFATHILALYLRGFPNQTFWREGRRLMIVNF